MVAARESRRLRYQELDLVPHLRALDGDADDFEARISRLETAIINIRLMMIMLTLVAGGDLAARIAGLVIK